MMFSRTDFSISIPIYFANTHIMRIKLLRRRVIENHELITVMVSLVIADDDRSLC